MPEFSLTCVPNGSSNVVLHREEDWGCDDFIRLCYGRAPEHASSPVDKVLVPKIREEDVVWTTRQGDYGEEMLDVIGGGRYGVVYRAVLRDQGREEQVVIKQNYIGECILHEAQVLQLLGDTGYVPCLHGLVLGCDKSVHRGLGIVQSVFGDGVTLENVLHDTEILPRQQRPYVAWHLAVGLKAIHDLGILINDLHAGNVLLDPYSSTPVRFIDFGFATFGSADNMYDLADEETQVCIHLAPEIKKGQPVTPESDVYSLGIIIQLLCTEIDDYEPPPLMKEAEQMCTDEDPKKRDLEKIIYMLHKIEKFM